MLAPSVLYYKLILLVLALSVPGMIYALSGQHLGIVHRVSAEHLKSLVSSIKPNDHFHNAGNATLGFSKIMYINLPSRFDYDDAMFMQSTTSGLILDQSVAVDATKLDDSGKGFPPSEGEPLHAGARACTRSHVNLWKQMLQENWESLLILESDAAWDVNIRDINHRVAKGLYELRKTLNESTPLPAKDDPFGSRDGDWDFISFGSCFDGDPNKDDFIFISDPHLPDGHHYYGRPLNGQRAVRRAGGMICTTGYAVNRKGAAKMLLRTSIASDKPVDLILSDVIGSGEVKAYSTYPPTIAQWRYLEGIGAEKLDSNINNNEKGETDHAKEIWEKIKKEKNAWDVKKGYDKTIKNMALAAYNKLAYE